jgi:hypothetical protein
LQQRPISTPWKTFYITADVVGYLYSCVTQFINILHYSQSVGNYLKSKSRETDFYDLLT